MLALLASILVASVLGSLHCLGMCGPIAALATARADRVHLPQLGRASGGSSPALGYNGGRLLSYLALGALAGAIGMAVDLGGAQLGWQRAATWLTGGSLVVIGGLGLIRAVAARQRPLAPSPLVRLLARLARPFARLGPQGRALSLGVLTPLIPCGWLHAFTLTAAGTSSPAWGAAVMGSFWLGTVPAMLVLGASMQRLSSRLRVHLPWLIPAMVLAVGLFTLGLRGPVPTPPDPEADDPPAASVEAPREAPCH